MSAPQCQPFDDDAAPDREREDLVDLLASSGWRRFCEHVAEVWSDTETVRRVTAFAGSPNVGDQRETAGQILAGRQAVHAVMAWPQSRVHALTTPVRTAPRLPRRGRV